jgi:lipopolysaccharide transport system permease protein
MALAGRFVRGANPAYIVRNLWSHRYLVVQLTWREITGRYRSSMLGFLWSFITPLVTLALYTFVFGVVFRARWPGSSSDRLSEYGLVLFAGLIAFALVGECVNRAPTLITSQPNYVKKVVFPLEILPVTILGAALFHLGISVLILAAAQQVILGGVVWTLPVLPLVVLPLALLALGVSWALASLGVFFRDVSQVVTLGMQILFFTTPVFYSLEAVPARYRGFLELNPLTPMIENVRRVAIHGAAPDWEALLLSVLVGLLAAALGHAWFTQTKRAFADVI